ADRLAAAERANRELVDKAARWQADREQRFEGTPLVGESVVFLVDMSGSMEKADQNTASPNKWPAVCDTVAKLMASVPTLARYQVVVFSKSARWLVGGEDWQVYKGQESVATVRAELGKIRPMDGTNLYAGFELAFKLHPKGLDTIYLFSDGLPNIGPGLSPAQVAMVPPLEESRQAEILGRYTREQLRTTWNPQKPGGRPVRINSIGFYFETPELGAFLWAISRENNGNFVGMCRP
ncbi:MAG TPA: vWA domain-containing protein, partial [Urbifossiella sp.]|nr:vWA domain-containing protein [Urbifossiella sp.]